jgi:hypothetical protein
MNFLEMHSLHPELDTAFSSLLRYSVLRSRKITLFSQDRRNDVY